jgi:hypothetical protein
MGGKQVKPLEVSPLQATYTPLYSLQRNEGNFALGYFRGAPAFVDLDKSVVQPLVNAEQRFTLDIVDARKAFTTVTLPIGAAAGVPVVSTLPITVPAGEVWFLGEHFILIEQQALLAGAVSIDTNFTVSSFPKLTGGADKPYYDAFRQVANTTLIAAIIAADVPIAAQFQAGDELGVPLRAVAGTTFYLVATPIGGAVAGGAVTVDLTLYGVVGKILVT